MLTRLRNPCSCGREARFAYNQFVGDLRADDGCYVQGRAETELAKALDTPTTRLLVARPGYFFPAHTGQRQNQHGGIGRFLDTTIGHLFTNTSMGVPVGILGSFLVESAKGSFPNVSLANNVQIKQLLKDLQKQ